MNKTSAKKISFSNLLKLFLLIIVLLAGLKLLLAPDTVSDESLDDAVPTRQSFSKCLNERGVIMYGVDTCEYCETQKKMFGLDFQEILYVNCGFETEQCNKKGITRYPVWQIGDKLLPGIQTFISLARETGCRIPK